MNIIVAVNSKYLNPLCVTLYSLSVHNNSNIKVYVLHFDISSDEQNDFRKKMKKCKHISEVIFLQVDFNKFSTILHNKRYTQVANLRLAMLSVLPVDIHKVLWLDADLIVKGNLERFYSYPNRGQFAIVCEDMLPRGERLALLSQLGMERDTKYFNSGVMLFYLDNVRKHFREDAFLDWMYENQDKLLYPDQNALNVCFAGRVIWANPYRYNLQLLRINKKSEFLKTMKQAKIIHYNMKEKPWNKDYNGVLKWQYWQYGIRALGIRKFFAFLGDFR